MPSAEDIAKLDPKVRLLYAVKEVNFKRVALFGAGALALILLLRKR